ncbi:hypothetical protein [Actinomadura sp. HBU206391]|uniref:hypothetical protein n=1 Tax=Actinomadura sp. HBU206391 TaxID=2731692 RepID=UPI0021C5E4D2|nr:hypothetical protein [Actinomadura sp. HBU206391]
MEPYASDHACGARGRSRRRTGVTRPKPLIDAVLDELRTTGSPERVRAELAKREQELYRRSLRRLRGSAALHTYLQRVRALP